MEDQDWDMTSVIMEDNKKKGKAPQTRERSPLHMQSPAPMEEDEEEEEVEEIPDRGGGEASSEMVQYVGPGSSRGSTGWQPPAGRYPPMHQGGGPRVQQLGRRTQVIQAAMDWRTGQSAAYEYNVYEYEKRQQEEMEGYDWYGFDSEE